MNNKSKLLVNKLSQNSFLIVAHRGQFKGNIIENSIEAMILAINLKADIVELDLMSSIDGILYLFHDDRELALFGRQFKVSELNSACIDELAVLNTIGCISGKRLNRFDNAMKALKGNTLINIDRAWNLGRLMLPLLDLYDMYDQVLLKSSIDKSDYIYRLSDHPTKYMFVGIVETKEQIELFMEIEDLNLVGFEIIIKDHNAPLLDLDYLLGSKEKGYLIWRNALVLDAKYALLDFGDDLAMTGNEDQGWGKLISQHANIIQTDWVSELANYRKQLSERE